MFERERGWQSDLVVVLHSFRIQTPVGLIGTHHSLPYCNVKSRPRYLMAGTTPFHCGSGAHNVSTVLPTSNRSMNDMKAGRDLLNSICDHAGLFLEEREVIKIAWRGYDQHFRKV